MVKINWLEKVPISDFICSFGLKILRLQSHLYSNSGANLEIINMEHSWIRKQPRLSRLPIIHERVGPIAE